MSKSTYNWLVVRYVYGDPITYQTTVIRGEEIDDVFYEIDPKDQENIVQITRMDLT